LGDTPSYRGITAAISPQGRLLELSATAWSIVAAA